MSSSINLIEWDAKGTSINDCTEVRFASFLSGGFTTMALINPPEWELAKRTTVHWYSFVDCRAKFL